MLTDVAGIRVGHWTNQKARTGCTVIVLPPETTASGEVRGGAPATREFALLDPVNTVGQVDAVVLSGGSAFGLAAGDGVMGWLAEQGRGFKTRSGAVPIVVGMSLFDLGVGDSTVRPGAAEGRTAAQAAAGGAIPLGLVGAGTGATVAKWLGGEPSPGGLVSATMRSGELVVSTLVAVNAFGMIDDGTTVDDPGPPVREAEDEADEESGRGAGGADRGDRTNTTIGVVATNANVDKLGCHLLAQGAHDGLARSLFPAHTRADGDAFVACATGEVESDPMHLRLLVQQVVTTAVRGLAPASG